jgi:hypothetical protein
VKEQELPKLPSSWSNRRLKRLLDDPENLLMFDDEDDEEEQIEDSVLTDFEEEECKWFKSQRNWRK